MNDREITCSRPLPENEELRRRVKELEAAEAERKRAEEALRESEARFRSLFRDSVTGMAVVAPNGELVETNPAFCEFLGYSEEEMKGKTIRSITHPEDWEGTSKVMRQGLISGPRLLRFETRYLHKNGQVLWGEVNSTLVCNAKGSPTHFIAQVLDVSERKRAEEAWKQVHNELERRVEERTAELRKANEELAVFRRFAEASRQGFGMADMDGLLTYINPAACRIVGAARPEDIIGKHLTEFYPQGYMLRRETEILPALRQEGHWEGELILSSAGKTMHVLQHSFLIEDEHGNPARIASVTTDITERKQIENRLAYLATFPEQSPNPIVEVGPSGDIRYMNPAACRLFPELREQGLQHPWFGSWEAVARELDKGRTEPPIHEVAVGGHWYQQSFYYAAWDRIVRIYGVDITEGKVAREAIRRSGEWLRLAQQVAQVGTFEWHIQTGLSTWTPELEAMYGLSPGEFPGTHRAWEKLVHRDDRASVVRLGEQAIETGEPVEGEWRVVWPDGSVHWLATRCQVFKDEAGKPLRMVGVNIDITERKRAEDALRRSEERFRVAFEEAPMGMMIAVGDGIITRVNHALCSITGYTPEELTGAEMYAMIHPEESERCVPPIQQLLAGKLPSVSLESRYLGKGDRVFWRGPRPPRRTFPAARWFLPCKSSKTSANGSRPRRRCDKNTPSFRPFTTA